MSCRDRVGRGATLATLLATALCCAPSSKSAEVPVATFVRRLYADTVPFDEGRSYGPEAVPVLLSMLADPAEKAHWHTIVLTLGMIGDQRAVDPLKAFVRSGGSEVVSEDVFSAKSNTLLALGYIVNQSGDRRALDYLAASLDPGVWSNQRGLEWVSPYQDVMDRDVHLATMAVMGLALSGHDEAERVLRSFKPTQVDGQFRARTSRVVEQALVEHRRVARAGLSAYYRDDPSP